MAWPAAPLAGPVILPRHPALWISPPSKSPAIGFSRAGRKSGSLTLSSAPWPQLLCALEDGAEPEISGRDNLETIALCEAVFAAAHDHRMATVQEFLAQ